MVCKEDVLSWFKDLESYNRINVMFELLNMCIPFEVRFLGSCIEEIGKHSYQELRGPAIVANDLEKLSKDSSLQLGLLDETTRHRIVIYISLLSARNCSCANWYFKNLLKTDTVEEYLIKNSKDDAAINEFVLLYTLGVHHPAFSYEQKRFFSEVLLNLLAIKEGKKRISPKPVYSYPPGFGYPTTQKPVPLNSSEVPVMPIKTASPVGFVEPTTLQHPPPGLPPHPVVPPCTPLDLMQPPLWTRPVFAATTCGAPEVPPFPPQPISPLVSQAATPPSSRAGSPHRTFSIRSNVPTPVMQQIHPQMEVLPPGPSPLPNPMPLDGLTNLAQPPPSLPPHIPADSAKNIDEEINHIPNDKLREPYMNSVVCDMKHMNGLRFPIHKYPPPYLIEQMQGLSIDGEGSLHRSSSSSSSSLNPSPPDTPNLTPAGTPHGPGRGGGEKLRPNGIPSFGPPAGLCDGSQAPPPPPFSNCSVPYTSCYQVNLAPMPSRSMFPLTNFNQQIRPPFTTAYTTYEYSYVPYVYSSIPPPAPAPRGPPNCYNCGALGHEATDCTGQTIEEITQKAYTLEYAPQEQDKAT